MNMRSELISQALNERFAALCGERVSQLAPEKFGALAPFVARVRERLLHATPADIRNSTPSLTPPESWMEADADCLAFLRALCLEQQLPLRRGQQPPVDSFVKTLSDCRHDTARRFSLLAERYACPLNFTLPAEDAVREHLLMRLMVQERARVEKNSITAINSDDLLLRLNLIAVHARLATDLRFLDALNYYYEVLPAAWQPAARHDWLLASYFALYARALAAWI